MKICLAALSGIAFLYSPVSFASDGPLTCSASWRNLGTGNVPVIECQVQVNTARITEVTLNRGRCSAPPRATQADRDLADRYEENMDEKMKQMFELTPEMAWAVLHIKATAPETEENREERAGIIALLKVAQDPRGEYQFGDALAFVANNCANLLEYTLTVNGREWTWRTR